jgi:hypothetical protein
MDELQSLFQSNPQGFASDMNYVQGTLVSWDGTSGANKVLLPGGTQLTNVKILNSNAFTFFNVGDSVALLLVNNQYTIMGKVKSAGNGLESALTNYVSAQEATTSATPVDLTTVGPTVTGYIGPSRRAWVIVSALVIALNVSAVATYEVSGASTIAAGSTPGGLSYGPASNATQFSSATCTNQILLTSVEGLNQGMNTFKMKYATQSGSASFALRRITVVPF